MPSKKPKDKKQETSKDVAKKNILSATDKAKILKDAKKIRERLIKEQKRYKRAKVKGETKRFYDRAAELVGAEAKKYTQRTIRSRMGKDAAITEELLAEAVFLKSFAKGSMATNVARRILTTRAEEKGKEIRATSQAGARFYGGLISLWHDPSASEEERKKAYRERDRKIIQAFGKRNLLQVMEHIEKELNINLIDMLQDPEKYAEAVNAIQSYIREKGLDEKAL